MTLEPSPTVDPAVLQQRLRELLVARGDDTPIAGDGDGSGLRDELRRLLAEEAPLLAPSVAEAVVEAVVDDVTGFGPLEPLLADPSVTEIMLNGPGRAYVERDGCIEPVALDVDAATIRRVVERAIRPLGLRCDRSSPIVDARLPDGSRLHAVLPPLAVDGPYVTVRRFGARPVPLGDFAPRPVLGVLGWAVAAGWNVVVAGGTGSGKTTLLNALSSLVAPSERIVTVEETAELRLRQPHVLRLEARPANAEGAGATSVRELVRAALRMRPDRIVVGEVRGPEALDLLEALNTGHDGGLSTVHANGPGEALLRLEGLALRGAPALSLDAVRSYLASALDAVVHVARLGDGRRAVVACAEVAPGRGGWEPRPLVVEGEVVAAPRRPARRHGIAPPPVPA